jgi:hypothetical protein
MAGDILWDPNATWEDALSGNFKCTFGQTFWQKGFLDLEKVLLAFKKYILNLLKHL